MKKIKITTDKEKFYRQVLSLLSSMSPVKDLRPKELEVLSRILYYNNEYKHLDEDARMVLIFSTQMRRTIREELGLSEDSFNNNVSRLRKLGILSSDSRLHTFFSSILFSREYEITFKLISNE